MPSNTLRQVAASRLKDDELEDYAQQFFKYSVIIEQQSGAIRHLEKEVTEAYGRVSEEHNERMKIPLQCEPSLEGLLNTLKYYGSLCEKQPQTVIDRVRIIFLRLILYTDHTPRNPRPSWQALVRLPDRPCQGWAVIETTYYWSSLRDPDHGSSYCQVHPTHSNYPSH